MTARYTTWRLPIKRGALLHLMILGPRANKWFSAFLPFADLFTKNARPSVRFFSFRRVRGVAIFSVSGNSFESLVGRHNEVSAGSSGWSTEAFALVAHANVLSGNKLEQFEVRLQSYTGRPK